eukprot:165315-Chlamydomonas_euryale.AAC.4
MTCARRRAAAAVGQATRASGPTAAARHRADARRPPHVRPGGLRRRAAAPRQDWPRCGPRHFANGASSRGRPAHAACHGSGWPFHGEAACGVEQPLHAEAEREGGGEAFREEEGGEI